MPHRRSPRPSIPISACPFYERRELFPFLDHISPGILHLTGEDHVFRLLPIGDSLDKKTILGPQNDIVRRIAGQRKAKTDFTVNDRRLMVLLDDL